MARMGRPTKLTDELVEQAELYLDETGNMSVNTLLPTIEGLALLLNIRRETLYEWEKENEDFSNILERLRALQAQKIMQNSMLNRYNPTISKLMLSKHGYIEQRQDDITSGGEKLGVALSDDQAAQLLKARQNR
jgi:hypothetical protein